MIVILGYYSAAQLWARQRRLTVHDWVPAISPESAVRALSGRDLDEVEIVEVHGAWNVLTPEVEAIIARLKALRTPLKSS